MTETANNTHIPVMDMEVIDALSIQSGGVYVDATFGRGGHSRMILDRLGNDGRLIVFDRDIEAIKKAKRDFLSDQRVSIIHHAFSHYQEGLSQAGVMNVDGVLFDLGLSSPQIDDPERGFSFKQDGPLDMRMNGTMGISARSWLERASKQEIAFVLEAYGQEVHAGIIADAICQKRQVSPIITTKDLVDVVVATVPDMKRNHHPATLVFQAIRIYINDEMEQINAGITQALSSLNNKGRLVVLSYHSLETKWVNVSVKGYVKALKGDYAHRSFRVKKLIKGQKATTTEMQDNRRSRSAMLKVWEKVYG